MPVSDVYASEHSESTATATFRVYYTAPSASNLASARDLDDDGDGDGTNSNGVVFVCVHGAGYSGLSYACVAKSLVERGRGRIGVLSYDARGHGQSYSYFSCPHTVPVLMHCRNQARQSYLLR